MIVVALYQDHYVVVPMYTHQHRGLNDPRHDIDEWVSVQDHRSPLCEQQSNHKPLVTSHLDNQVTLFDPKSVAHITAPVSRFYNAPCRLEGQLDGKSTYRLVRLYSERIPDPENHAPEA